LPPIKIRKRTETGGIRSFAIRTTAILAALVVTAAFIALLGKNPIDVYASMVTGALGNPHRLRETIIRAVPLVVTSLGIAIAFKMKFWNIGADGQIIMGAFGASYFALNCPNLPQPLLLLVMAAAGMIAGGLWAFIPAFFKARFGTNETLFTLMMNYVAQKWVTYLQYGPWKDPKAIGFPKIPNFVDNAILPKVFGIHIGWIIALVLVAVVHVFMKRTKKGYEIAVVGESVDTARYAGMNVRGIILSALFASGALCGLAGMIQASAVSNTLAVDISGGAGYTAIITTWLAQLSAPAIVIVSFLFAVLVQGGSYIQTAFQIPQAAAQILQGMILFFVLGSEFFVNYRVALGRTAAPSESEVPEEFEVPAAYDEPASQEAVATKKGGSRG
jgi:general nucleoside transport system permease protein